MSWNFDQFSQVNDDIEELAQAIVDKRCTREKAANELLDLCKDLLDLEFSVQVALQETAACSNLQKDVIIAGQEDFEYQKQVFTCKRAVQEANLDSNRKNYAFYLREAQETAVQEIAGEFAVQEADVVIKLVEYNDGNDKQLRYVVKALIRGLARPVTRYVKVYIADLPIKR